MSMYVVTHKEYDSKILTTDYKILQVGSFRGHIKADCFDDEGDNISPKNPNYCELTGLYWLWKNCNDSYIGISHYRRYFTHDFRAKKAITPDEMEVLLDKYDIVLPFHATYKKTIAEDYAEISGKKEDLVRVGNIIKRLYPDYYGTYQQYLNSKSGTLYNMMIIKKDNFDRYCQWLFGILFDLEKEIDLSEYNDYQKRIYGFLAERLLNVWVLHNGLKRCEISVIPTEETWSFPVKVLTGLKRVILYKFL